MPLLRIDVVKGRSEGELETLLQAIHDAMLAAFRVPERDRYQVLTEHDPGRMVLEDTGLGIVRSDRVVLIQMTTRRRTAEEKQAFYGLVVDALGERCGVRGEDVIISCVENGDADWSFGHGQAQFLTGEL